MRFAVYHDGQGTGLATVRADGALAGRLTSDPHCPGDLATLIAEGMGNKAIAERLFISENTVKNHVRNIHEKLQVHSRMEAVVRAVRDGVLRIA